MPLIKYVQCHRVHDGACTSIVIKMAYALVCRDLFGAVSDPLVLSRTIITGKSAPIVYRLLYILSYFIRCSEVEEGLFKQVAEMQEYLDTSDVFTQESRASSTATLGSDGGRHSSLSGLLHSNSLGTETPVIRPHPFSFSRSGSRSHHSSRSDSFTSDIIRGGSLSHSMSVTESLDRRLASHHNPIAAITSSCSSMPATPPSRRTSRGGGFKPSLESCSPSIGTCSDSGVQVNRHGRVVSIHRGGTRSATQSLPCSQKTHAMDGSLLGVNMEENISMLVEDAHSRMQPCCSNCASQRSVFSLGNRDCNYCPQVDGMYSRQFMGTCPKHEECVCYGLDLKQDARGGGGLTDPTPSLKESVQHPHPISRHHKSSQNLETSGNVDIGPYQLCQSRSIELIPSHAEGLLIRNHSGSSLGAQSLPPGDVRGGHRPSAYHPSYQTSAPHIGSFDSGVSCLTSITDSARYTDVDSSLYSTPTRSRAGSMQRRGSSTALTQSTTSRSTEASSFSAASRTGLSSLTSHGSSLVHPMEASRTLHSSNPERSLELLPSQMSPSPTSSLGVSSSTLTRPLSASSGVFQPSRRRSDAFSFPAEQHPHQTPRNRSLSPKVEANTLSYYPHVRALPFFRTIEHSKARRSQNSTSSTTKSDHVQVHRAMMRKLTGSPQSTPTHAPRYSPQPGPHPLHHAPLQSSPSHLHQNPVKQPSWGTRTYHPSRSNSSFSQASSSPLHQPSSWTYDNAFPVFGHTSPTPGPSSSIKKQGYQSSLHPPSRPSSVQDMHRLNMDSRSFSTPSLIPSAQVTSNGTNSLQKTNSWRGLPAIDGCFPEPPESNCPLFVFDDEDIGRDEVEEGEEEEGIVMNTLKVSAVQILGKSTSCIICSFPDCRVHKGLLGHEFIGQNSTGLKVSVVDSALLGHRLIGAAIYWAF